MKARGWLTPTIVAALLAPGVARAQGLEGRFSIAFQAGTQSEVAGDLMKGTQGTLIGKPVTLESKRYRDVYAPDVRLQGHLGFGLSDKLEIVALGTYYRAEATPVAAGTREELSITAEFEPPYEEVGFEVGLRWYLASTGRLKSYLGPTVGARWVNEILVSFSIPEAGSALRNVPFSAKGTVPVFGLDLGFTFDLGDHVFVGLNSSIKYQFATREFDDQETLTQIDDSEGRWTAPVVVSLGVRF